MVVFITSRMNCSTCCGLKSRMISSWERTVPWASRPTTSTASHLCMRHLDGKWKESHERVARERSTLSVTGRVLERTAIGKTAGEKRWRLQIKSSGIWIFVDRKVVAGTVKNISVQSMVRRLCSLRGGTRNDRRWQSDLHPIQ